MVKLQDVSMWEKLFFADPLLIGLFSNPLIRLKSPRIVGGEWQSINIPLQFVTA